ncbi:MAG: CheB methylesterase [Myxococcaceae bacterium]|nr:CheB methylesterase [Myxococcaceae bacterium]
MSKRDVIVIGASAGGVEALVELFTLLPPKLDAVVFVVLHVAPTSSTALASILARKTKMHVHDARDRERVAAGHVYIARPDHHLLVKDSLVRTTRGPQENGHRPAIDPLFRSAARAYGARVIGVVLSGSLDDGTSGLAAVKMRGGLAIVQDPATATFASMPQSAIDNVVVDHVLPIPLLATLLPKLVAEEVPTDITVASPALHAQNDVAFFDTQAAEEARENGVPSAFSCPDCHGVLWQLNEGDLLRYRCRTGHAYSEQALLAQQSESLEEALWVAYRALRERAALAHRMAARAPQTNTAAQAQLAERARSADAHADVVRELLEKLDVAIPLGASGTSGT